MSVGRGKLRKRADAHCADISFRLDRFFGCRRIAVSFYRCGFSYLQEAEKSADQAAFDIHFGNADFTGGSLYVGQSGRDFFDDHGIAADVRRRGNADDGRGSDRISAVVVSDRGAFCRLKVMTVAGRAADKSAEDGERQVYLSVVSEDGKIYNGIAKIKTQRMMLRMLAHGEPRLYQRVS